MCVQSRKLTLIFLEFVAFSTGRYLVTYILCEILYYKILESIFDYSLFIEALLYARHFSKCWGYINLNKPESVLEKLHSSGKRQAIKRQITTDNRWNKCCGEESGSIRNKE